MEVVKVGIGWGSDGPEAGFFPFYVGLFIAGGSVINLVSGLRENPDAIASRYSQLRQVLKVLVPTAHLLLLAGRAARHLHPVVPADHGLHEVARQV